MLVNRETPLVLEYCSGQMIRNLHGLMNPRTDGFRFCFIICFVVFVLCSLNGASRHTTDRSRSVGTDTNSRFYVRVDSSPTFTRPGMKQINQMKHLRPSMYTYTGIFTHIFTLIIEVLSFSASHVVPSLAEMLAPSAKHAKRLLRESEVMTFKPPSLVLLYHTNGHIENG